MATLEQARQHQLEQWSAELTELRNELSSLDRLRDSPGWSILRRELATIIRYKRDEISAKPLVGDQIQLSTIIQGYIEGLTFARDAIDRLSDSWRVEIDLLKRNIEDVNTPDPLED